ncbi:MAG: acetylornithine deacetylase [Alphaproteobacteria bacterium]|nr:acetylornithine deacetylase [Alphaproteobacteria bacterium]
MRDIKHILAKLISFDTVSRHSNLELIKYIKSYLSDLGIESRLVHNDEKTKANLYTTIGPHVAGGVILSGHTDVVPVDGQDWASDPFELTERGDKYFGRGTCDMKGFVAICLAAVPDMIAADLKRPIHLCFSYDEETGCQGAQKIVPILVQNLPPVEAVIIGEPTSMQVANLHKSYNTLITRIRGVEAHSSKTNLGVSANFAAAKLINFLSDLLDEFKQNPNKSITSLVPNYNTLNVGILNGGTANNIIPNHCEFLMDLRTLPDDEPDKYIDQFREFAQTVEKQMQDENPACQIEIVRDVIAPGLQPERGGNAEKLALNLTSSNHAVAVSFGTEAGLFQRAGYSTIICGPGSIDQAHKPDEFIEIEQIKLGALFIEKLITRMKT